MGNPFRFSLILRGNSHKSVNPLGLDKEKFNFFGILWAMSFINM